MTEWRTDYLSASFLERVRRSYKLALTTVSGRYGRIWETIDQRRAPVHAALLAGTDVELRNIFSNPVSSDLFLGVDPLCHSILGQLPPIGQPSEQTIPSLYMWREIVFDHLMKRQSRTIFALRPTKSCRFSLANAACNHQWMTKILWVASICYSGNALCFQIFRQN